MLVTILFYLTCTSFITFLLVVFLVPSYFQSHLFVLGVTTFIKKGKLLSFTSFVLLAAVCALNRSLMTLEDVLFPGLAKVADEYFTKRNRLVFVIGHQRSGTTNVHKAVSSLASCTTGT